MPDERQDGDWWLADESPSEQTRIDGWAQPPNAASSNGHRPGSNNPRDEPRGDGSQEGGPGHGEPQRGGPQGAGPRLYPPSPPQAQPGPRPGQPAPRGSAPPGPPPGAPPPGAAPTRQNAVPPTQQNAAPAYPISRAAPPRPGQQARPGPAQPQPGPGQQSPGQQSPGQQSPGQQSPGQPVQPGAGWPVPPRPQGPSANQGAQPTQITPRDVPRRPDSPVGPSPPGSAAASHGVPPAPKTPRDDWGVWGANPPPGMGPPPDAPTMFDLPVIRDPIPGVMSGAQWGQQSTAAPTVVQPAITEEEGGGLLRSSAMMALGTIASRGTGFIRTAIIVIALGTRALGDAYNTANTIPNIVYDLLLGGILTAVHVPLLVRARERGREYGEAFEQRLFTLLLGVLAALTVIAMVAAPLLIDMYGNSFTGPQRHLAVTFALFFLPQIFFYGFGAVAGASLNARGRFAAPMWTPVLNNIVVSIVAVAFLLIAGPGTRPESITNGEVNLLAIGTTGGIVIQSIALIPSLRAIGFKWRPRLDFQPGELRSLGNVGGWTLFYVVVQQVGMVVNTNIANASEVNWQHLHPRGVPYGVGYTVFANAYQLFQLPFAIVTVSVMTALLPRMSRHAAERRFDLVQESLSSGLRLSSVIVIPAAALLFALAAEISTLFFNHGAVGLPDALMIANVLQAFALALVPFMMLQLLQRGFYALADTRTPALISVFTISISIGLAVIGYYALPTDMVVEGIAISLGISWAVGCVVTAAILRTRLGGLHGSQLVQAHVKIVVATLPALSFALVIHQLFQSAMGKGMVGAAAALIVGGGGGCLLYFVVARRLRIREVESLYRTVIARLPGRVSG